MLTDKELEEIRRKMLELEEEPPSDAWNRIKVEVQPPDMKWRPIGWFGIVLLLLISTLGAYYFTVQPPASDIKVVPDAAMQEREEKKVASIQQPDKAPQLEQLLLRPATAPAVPGSAVSPDSYSIDDTTISINTQNRQETVEQAQELSQSSVFPEQTPHKDAFSVIAVGEENKEPVSTDKKETLATTTTTTTTNTDMLSDRLESIVTVLQNKEKLVFPTAVNLSLPSAITTKPEPTNSTELEEVKKGKEWFLGLTVAPRYAFRSFSPTTADEVYIINLSSRKRLDPERMGYEFGLNIGNKMSEKLYLETSLSVMQLRENVSYSFTTGEVDTVLKSIASDGSLVLTPKYRVSERQLKSAYAYGGMRVGITYFFLERAQSRFNITAAAGVNLLVKGRTREYIDGEWSETIIFPSKDNILEQSNYNLLIGAGYNLRLRKKYELMMMPTLNYFLGSTFQEREPFGLRPYTLGLTIQVRRSFNRQ